MQWSVAMILQKNHNTRQCHFKETLQRGENNPSLLVSIQACINRYGATNCKIYREAHCLKINPMLLCVGSQSRTITSSDQVMQLQPITQNFVFRPMQMKLFHFASLGVLNSLYRRGSA